MISLVFIHCGQFPATNILSSGLQNSWKCNIGFSQATLSQLQHTHRELSHLQVRTSDKGQVHFLPHFLNFPGLSDATLKFSEMLLSFIFLPLSTFFLCGLSCSQPAFPTCSRKTLKSWGHSSAYEHFSLPNYQMFGFPKEVSNRAGLAGESLGRKATWAAGSTQALCACRKTGKRGSQGEWRTRECSKQTLFSEFSAQHGFWHSLPPLERIQQMFWKGYWSKR